jgi:hypothetical protein
MVYPVTKVTDVWNRLNAFTFKDTKPKKSEIAFPLLGIHVPVFGSPYRNFHHSDFAFLDGDRPTDTLGVI